MMMQEKEKMYLELKLKHYRRQAGKEVTESTYLQIRCGDLSDDLSKVP